MNAVAIAPRDVVRAGLVDSDVVALPDGPHWERLWADVRDEKAVPLLAQGVRTGAITATRRQRATIRRAHEDVMRACVMLERVAVDELARLAGEGIDGRLLKGAATAHLDYPSPAGRGFGDVDLLVRGDEYDRAVGALRAAGAYRRSDEVRPGFDRRFGKGVCMIRRDGVQIDLHRSLATGPFGVSVETDELFASRETFPLGGVPVAALDRDLRFVHACYHAVLGDFPPRLTALRDVAQMTLGGRLDLDRVRAVATRWRGTIVIAAAVATTWTTLRLPRTDAVEWAYTYVPSRYERWALGAYVGSRRSYARQMVAAVPAVRGWSARAAYVGSMVFADGAYLARRDGAYARRAARALRTGIAAGVGR